MLPDDRFISNFDRWLSDNQYTKYNILLKFELSLCPRDTSKVDNCSDRNPFCHAQLFR